MPGYLDRLRAASIASDSCLCVGLDPEPDVAGITAREAADYCKRIVEATIDLACSYKPNAAFWEQYGPEGWQALAEVRSCIQPELPVIFDAKRADVPNTMRAYATAIFDALKMDAATIHAYHGVDSIQEFTRHVDRGVYVVCHTSNPGRTDLQHLAIEGEPLYLVVAQLAADCNQSGNVGLVIGATGADEARIVRDAHPTMPFLLPGVGRQAGELSDSVAASWNGDRASCVIHVSGAILRADDPRSAAMSYRDQIRFALEEPVRTR